MSAITVDFGGKPLVVQFGENTELALLAAERAKQLATGAQRYGTIVEREAIPVADRKNGFRFLVTTSGDGSPIWREYEWRFAGQRNGPTNEGPILTAAQWCFLWTEREKLHFDIVPFQGTLPVANMEQVPTALANIADLSAVGIADFRATALTSGNRPLIELDARLLGLKPDSIKVAYGGVTLSIPGLPWRPKDQAAVKDFFVSGNSIDDATDVPMWHTILAARRGVTSHFTARYSSDKHQLARAGLDPTILTFAGNTLPVGGTSKLVDSLNGNSPIDINADYALLSTGDASLTTGVSLHGVIVDATNSRPGTLSAPNAASAAYAFAQDAGLPAITLSGPVTFIPDLAKFPATSDNFCGIGQNFFYSGVPGAFGDHTALTAYEIIDRFAAAADGNRFLIRDVLPSADWPAEGSPAGPINGVDYGNHQYSAMNAFNARNEARHPGSRARSLPRTGYPNGLTLLQFLQARGNGSANDNADIAAGLTPRSLRQDGLHLNLAGQTAMADFFGEAMQAQKLAAYDLTTSFTLSVTGTKPAIYPDEPVASSANAVAQIEFGPIVDLSDQLDGIRDEVDAARSGMGERLREAQVSITATGGATSITTAGVASGLAIPASQAGTFSFIRSSLPMPPEISARFAGAIVRLKAVYAATANFLTERPIATASTVLGTATFADGSSVNTGFAQQVLAQSGGFVTREVTYTLAGGESQLAILSQLAAPVNSANAHSLEIMSLSLVVDAVPAGAAFTAADVTAAWRAYDQRIGIGPIFADALGLGVSQNNGATYLTVGGRVLGISTASGATGQNSAAGIVLANDVSVAPLFASKTGRARFALLTSAAFTRALTATMRTRYAIQFTGTISGNVLTLTSPCVNAVTGAPIAMPAGSQGVYINGVNGTLAFFMSGLASGTSGAVGSTYTLQNAQTGYTLPTTFTLFAYRFLACAVETDIKISSTRRIMSVAALPNQPFVGDELFIEPYVSQNGTVATASVETWQIEDASFSLATVAPGTIGGLAEVAQNIAHRRAIASARALAAADAQANYFFGIGDVLAQCAIADQINAGTGGTVLSGNTATIPSGSSGQNMIFQRVWPLDGAGNAGKRIRLKLGFITSGSFTRTLSCAFQVRTASGTSARSATLTQQISGRSIVYTLDYTIQGDEIALAPYVICQSNTPTAAVETWTYASMLPYFVTASAPGRTSADENISQLASNILAQAAALIVNGNGAYATVKTVKPSGGDFTHPKLAIDAITDASAAKRYAVLIYPGVYDGYAEWHTKDFVDLIGVGRREEVIIQYALPNNASAATITGTSTFWWDSASNLINLTVTARNMRYAVHQETNGQRPGITQIAENCVFIHYGNTDAVNNTWQVGSQAAVGTGSSDGMTAIHRFCRFRGPGVTGYHGPNAGPARARPIKFRYEGCEMVVTRNGVVVTDQPAMVVNSLQQAPGDTLELVGNSIGGRVHYAAGWLNAGDTTTNRAQISIVGYGNTPFTFVNEITGAPGGDYVPQLTGRS